MKTKTPKTLEGYTMKKCRERIAYEFKPKKRMTIALKEAEKVFKHKFVIQATTPFVLIGRYKGKSFSVFSSGKILVKAAKEEKEAKDIAEHIVRELKKAKKSVKYIEVSRESTKGIVGHAR